MKVYRAVLVTLIIVTISCGLPELQNTSATPSVSPDSTNSISTATAVPESTGPALTPFITESSNITFSDISLTRWDGKVGARQDASLPLDLNQIANSKVITDLTPDQRAFLTKNGFVILQTQESQFYLIRNQVAKNYGQPYYLTTDAAYHALHLTFDETLKALEKEKLRPQIMEITSAALQEVMTYIPLVAGTTIDLDTHTAAAYLAVGMKLFDPQSNVDPSLEPLVSQQVDKIMAGEGKDQSLLIPEFIDDYGAYKPVGHYAGDPDLESYFRGMTWFGRTFFKLLDPTNMDFKPSRAPLIITLALRQATIQGSDRMASEDWTNMNEVLSFLIGPSDDAGPIEYAKLMDKVYGNNITITSLADESKWSEFLNRGSELPSPQINSTFINSLLTLEGEKGWRFMGQRFTLDSMIIQNLVFDKVGTQENPRMVPSGLDVMSVLGSTAGLNALEKSGANKYENFSTQLDMLKQRINAQSENEWLNQFYSSWLYAFLPSLAEKNEDFPPYMQTILWGVKELNSALGSWAELKHDTVLYTKMPEPAGGGGPPASGPPPGYVEPTPDVFYRMAYLANSLSDGLAKRYFGELEQPTPMDYSNYDKPMDLGQLLTATKQLGEQFNNLGDIAAKELAGEDLNDSDWEIINGCLGPTECMVLKFESYGWEGQLSMPPVPIISAVSGAGEQDILEAATGNVDRIYVVVPIEGKLQVAQGGVFSYYEFVQPRNNRLTDQEWRDTLGSNPPQGPAWMTELLLPGGKAKDILAFRIGDWYIVNKEGAGVNLRSDPSRSAKKMKQLDESSYFEIIDGPVSDGVDNWWNIKTWNEETGWIIESQEWYDRARGQ